MNAEIPFVDFGGNGPIVHLAHANGFPAGTYQQLVNKFPDHHFIAMNAQPLWPNSDHSTFHTWQQGADDLIDFLDQRKLSGIVGMGHSFGAICTIMAANKRPDLFTRLVLIEPVVLPKWFYLMNSSLPRYLIKQINPVIKKTLVRREHWPARESAFHQLRRSKLFAGTSDRSLWDYVNSVTSNHASGGVFLTYSKEWEAQIFFTVTDPWKEIARLQIPFLVLRGESSDTIFPEVWKKLKSTNPNGLYCEFENAGHLLPIERPDDVAANIRSFLTSQ